MEGLAASFKPEENGISVVSWNDYRRISRNRQLTNG
jgi:hypothetical protein